MEVLKDNKLILGAPSTCFQFKPKCASYTLDDKAPGYRLFLLYPDGKIESNIYRI
jgi:Icc protein